MRSFGVLSVPLLASLVQCIDIHEPLDCGGSTRRDVDACASPIDEIVAIVPGSSYVAKIEHKEQRGVRSVHEDDEIVENDTILVCSYSPMLCLGCTSAADR